MRTKFLKKKIVSSGICLFVNMGGIYHNFSKLSHFKPLLQKLTKAYYLVKGVSGSSVISLDFRLG